MLVRLRSVAREINKWSIVLRFRVLYPNLTLDPTGFYCGRAPRIGRECNISIGRNFYMGHHCHLSTPAIIGNDVLLASQVSFVGGDHKIDGIDVPMRLSGRDQRKVIVVEDDVWIGHGSIILHGVRLGSGCIVAAGSVVTKDVDQHTIVGGNPARVIRRRQLLPAST